MTPPETARHQARPPKLFKRRKELLVLSLASVVFVIVIYKTYLSKGSSPAETAEINPAVLDASGTAGRPAPPVHEALARLNTDDTPAPEQPQPLRLSRDPFSMSQVLRDGIYRVNPAQDQTSSEPVVITAENFQSTLARIPGAEQAAAKGLKLDAIMITDTWQGAVINDKTVPLGHTILGFTLVKVSDDRVTLERDRYRITLLVRPPDPGNPDAPGDSGG